MEEQEYQQPVVRQEPVHNYDEAAEDLRDSMIEDRIFASLSYISILFVVPMVLRNEDEDIHFHAKQGLVLFGAEVAVWLAIFLLDTFLAIIFPAGEIALIRVIGAIAWVGFMALSIAGIYVAARGKKWKMPVLYRIAQRIKV